jgi:murein DD-endopeptidase MepM/ murein hydrolase activator NlpD
MFSARVSGPTTSVLVALLTAVVPRSLSAAEPVGQLTVHPGGVVRWHGSGSWTCGLDGEEWPAIDDTCWYPIDILADEGPLTLRRTRGDATERTTVHVGPYPYPEQMLTVDPEMVRPPETQLERIRLETERVGALWNRPGPARFTLPLAPPLRPLPEARSFGSRRILNDEPRSPHSGVDFSGATGTPVFAVADGLVVLADEHYFAGKSIYIDHGDQLVSMYFHLSEISVSEGDAVLSGTSIGAVGATGRVTGTHLHFGLRWHGSRIDPRVLLGPSSKITTIGE